MVNDVPEFGDQAPVTVRFDAIRCGSCGKVNNPPTPVVARWPDPRAPDENRPRCHDCYAELLVELTGLEPDVARTLALTMCGYSHSQIGFVLGKAVTNVERLAKEARDEYRRARSDSRHIEAIYQYL